MHKRANYFFLLLIILSSLKVYGTELTEDTRRNKSSCCCSFLHRLTTRHINENIYEGLPAQSQTIIRSSNKIAEFPTRVVLNIASFLDYPNQLRLSHLNKKLKLALNEEFWESRIQENGYIIWDTTVPRLRIFFANYLYHKGFGRHPELSEKVEVKTEAVAFIPSLLLAEKALRLGFPKGRENLRQVQHKIRMNQMLHSSESSTSLSSYYIPTRVASYELIFKK